MPTSAPGNSGFSSGFTLIELMIVITIIGLASAVAVLAIPDPRGRVFDEAARFAARAKAASDIAVVEGRPVSLWVTSGGYGFDERLGGAWTPMSDKPFRVEQWQDGTRAQLSGSALRERITFDTTGLADRPMTLRLTRDRATVTTRIETNGSARVE